MRFARLALAIAPLTIAGLTGCSDPVPPTPQGAWYVSFQPPDNGAAQCQIAGHNSLVGSVTSSAHDAVIPNGTSDGGETAAVECSVVGSTKFDVYGKMGQLDKNLVINVMGITAAATEAAPAQGTVGYSSAQTAGNPYQSNMPCNFYFTPDMAEHVASGRIWVAFKCPSIFESSTMSTCQIKQGYAIFENCTQTAATTK